MYFKTLLASGMAAILAAHAGGIKTGLHSTLTGTVGDVYLKFPSATPKLADIV